MDLESKVVVLAIPSSTLVLTLKANEALKALLAKYESELHLLCARTDLDQQVIAKGATFMLNRIGVIRDAIAGLGLNQGQ